MKRIDVFWGGEEGLLFNSIKSEWSAGNFHRESAEQRRLSKMDTNTLSSRCDRSIMGEQLSKMNLISTVSQYKCHKLRRTWASSFPIPSSEVSKREPASKRSSGSRKALSTGSYHPRKDPPVTCQICHAVKLHAFKHINSHSCALPLSGCRKEMSTNDTSVWICWFLKLDQNVIVSDTFFLQWTNEGARKG